jgi:serine/threonine-protein kinase
MELMEGQTLTDIINQGPADPLRVCRIGAQIARGLQAVHDKGIVHRDLKPDNIFLVEREGKPDVVKIVDFGLAKSEAGQRLTQDGTVVGTAEYISPEQVTGQDTDYRSDQYSLGCILYEMLTAQLPFEGESTATLIYKHVYKNAVTPRKLRPEMNISSNLEAIVLKCMAKKPQDRFPTMAAVEQALLGEEQELAPRSTGMDTVVVRRQSFGNRTWLRWAGIGAGGVAFLLLAVFLLGRKSPPLPPEKKPARHPMVADMATVAVAPPQDLSVSPPAPVPSPPPSPPPGPPTTAETPEGSGDAGKPAVSKESTVHLVGNKAAHVPTVSVRFTVEPAAVSALVVCRSRRVTCRGGCQVQVPEGVACTISAPGYVSKPVRFKELHAERNKQTTFHVRLSPVKLKLH